MLARHVYSLFLCLNAVQDAQRWQAATHIQTNHSPIHRHQSLVQSREPTVSYTQPHRAQDHMRYTSVLLHALTVWLCYTRSHLTINSSDINVTSLDVYYTTFFMLGRGEAVPQLLSLSMKLFHKMMDAREPFHLTLLNVCFSNLQAKSSSKSSITSFFTPQTPTTPMTCQQQVSMCEFLNLELL